MLGCAQGKLCRLALGDIHQHHQMQVSPGFGKRGGVHHGDADLAVLSAYTQLQRLKGIAAGQHGSHATLPLLAHPSAVSRVRVGLGPPIVQGGNILQRVAKGADKGAVDKVDVERVVVQGTGHGRYIEQLTVLIFAAAQGLLLLFALGDVGNGAYHAQRFVFRIPLHHQTAIQNPYGATVFAPHLMFADVLWGRSVQMVLQRSLDGGQVGGVHSASELRQVAIYFIWHETQHRFPTR